MVILAMSCRGILPMHDGYHARMGVKLMGETRTGKAAHAAFFFMDGSAIMEKAWAAAMVVTVISAVGCNDGRLSVVPDPKLDWTNPKTPRNTGGGTTRTGGTGRSPVADRTVRGEADWANTSGSRTWKYIVIHHSATESGSAAEFDAAHRNRGWDGLGYHFVIDNGDGGPSGNIEVGPRWRIQKWGAHTGNTPDNEYNNHGIGICVVGDFSRRLPSQAQLASMQRLVCWLMARYDIPAYRVVGHRDAPGAKTECPGDRLHAYIHGAFRMQITRR